eukprot:Transcript_12911.p1 GENE.Transcript_12911~~Transcript_12911.p1  ORF type:complete len:414 (+),score=166.50 Transcript_12911:99-1340(+)
MMMDVEFDAAAKKFTKDRRAEQKKDIARKSREAAEKAKARAQQALWEREAEMRRQEEAARAAEEARIYAADLEANRGVVFSKQLRAVLSLTAEAKGIVRRADKISLPYSAKVALEEQQASKNGQLFFELSTADGRRTHAAILDYSAEEGTVGCPPELLRCLGLAQEQLPVDQASRHLVSAEPPVEAAPPVPQLVTVRYRRLEKGTFAMLQPLRHSFHDVADVKALLEQQLQRRATLTKGDEVMVAEVVPAAAAAPEGEAAAAEAAAAAVKVPTPQTFRALGGAGACLSGLPRTPGSGGAPPAARRGSPGAARPAGFSRLLPSTPDLGERAPTARHGGSTTRRSTGPPPSGRQNNRRAPSPVPGGIGGATARGGGVAEGPMEDSPRTAAVKRAKAAAQARRGLPAGAGGPQARY